MSSATAKGKVSEQLLGMLRCPRTRQALHEADPQLLERTNRAIRAGKVQDIGGTKVDKPIDGGLVTDDGKLLYAVIDRIPVLLPDEAIEVESLETP